MRGSWRPNRTAIYWPHSYGHQRCVFLILLMLNRRPRGPTLLAFSTASYHQLVWSPNSIGGPEGPVCWVVAFPTTSCLQLVWSPIQLEVLRAPSAGCWLSLPHLVSYSSDLQLPDFLSSLSYIIVKSFTQSLEWHVWSSSSGNNCHAVHGSLPSGASVYECTMGFYLVPYFQPSPPTWFLLITAIGMCHFLPVHHFGMACLAGSKVNIQHKFLKHHLTKQLLYSHLPPIWQAIRWTKHARHCWRSNVQLASTHEHTSVIWPAKTYILQFCVNAGCRFEDLTTVVDKRDGWQEKVKGIYAISIT